MFKQNRAFSLNPISFEDKVLLNLIFKNGSPATVSIS